MGLLDEYGIDTNEYETASYENPEDGYYEFEIADVFLREGTENYPDKRWIIFRYIIGDTGKQKDEWFQLPQDASDPTDAERQAIGFYKARLISLGFDEGSLNDVTREDIIGITGTLKLETRKGKNGGSFQNIYNVKVMDEAPVKAAPASRPGVAPGRPAARPAVRPAPAPAPQEAADGSEDEADDTEAPEAPARPAARSTTPPVRAGRPAAARQAQEQRAAQAGIRKNPFG